MKKLTLEEANIKKSSKSRLTAIGFIQGKLSKLGFIIRKVECLCECGNKTTATLSAFIFGDILSCGCYKTECLRNRKKYTHVIKELRGCYDSMMQRCYKPNSKMYKYYGGIGVRVCDEWKNSYQNFLDWALANGWNKTLQLDKDIKGDGMLYSPDTCCFVDGQTNKKFSKRSLFFNYKGENTWLPELAKKFNIKYGTLNCRLKTGMSIEDAISKPILHRKYKIN